MEMNIGIELVGSVPLLVLHSTPAPCPYRTISNNSSRYSGILIFRLSLDNTVELGLLHRRATKCG